MQDISAFGTVVTVAASNTFPAGFTVTQFADDADGLDSPSIKIAETAMGVNGDLVSWSKAAPIPLTLNVVPGSEDDINLGLLFEANRVGKGKISARDVISVTVVYPSGQVKSFTNGTITDGAAANSAASAGRLKSKAYMFAFENVNGV